MRKELCLFFTTCLLAAVATPAAAPALESRPAVIMAKTKAELIDLRLNQESRMLVFSNCRREVLYKKVPEHCFLLGREAQIAIQKEFGSLDFTALCLSAVKAETDLGRLQSQAVKANLPEMCSNSIQERLLDLKYVQNN